MEILENLTYWVEFLLCSFAEGCFIVFLDKYLFLKDYTKEQKRKIQIFFYISAATVIIATIVDFIDVLYDLDFTYSDFTYCPSEIFEYILKLSFVPFIIYTNMAGRKKAKWLSIIFMIPLIGYCKMLDFIYDLIDFLPFPLYMHIYIIVMIFSIFVCIVMFYLNNEKTKPEFIRNFESDIKNMSYTAAEAAGIWLIGCLLFVYDAFLAPHSLEQFEGNWIFKGMSKELEVFVDILICIFGIVVTFFIINSSYRRYYYQKNLKYQKTLITTMANLVESRDENTGGHIHRTAKYSEIIARQLQNDGKFKDILTDRYIEDMVIAAPLHDVGKIHISDQVLNKPGRLNDEEFAAMKSHTAAGGEIIDHVEEEVGEDISYLRIAKEMAEYHHERIDGKGYPHGISGDEIPLCAKILAVADVFDALMSKRCYKDPMPLEKALAIIREETGDHFDEDVSKAFFDSIDEIKQFLNDISDEEKAGITAKAN